jgi:hypothetical protein
VPVSAAIVNVAAPLIHWTSLGKVAGVSFVFGLAIIVVFSCGVVGVGWIRGHQPQHDAVEDASGLAAIDSEPDVAIGAARRSVGVALAATCFLFCAAAVAYGLYLIVPQFH